MTQYPRDALPQISGSVPLSSRIAHPRLMAHAEALQPFRPPLSRLSFHMSRSTMSHSSLSHAPHNLLINQGTRELPSSSSTLSAPLGKSPSFHLFHSLSLNFLYLFSISLALHPPSSPMLLVIFSYYFSYYLVSRRCFPQNALFPGPSPYNNLIRLTNNEI